MDGRSRAKEGVKEEEESPTRRLPNVGVKRNMRPRVQASKPAVSEERGLEGAELQSSDIENKDPKDRTKKGGAKGKNKRVVVRSGILAKKVRSKRKAEEDDYTEEEEEPPKKKIRKQKSRTAIAPKSSTRGAHKLWKGKHKATDDDLEQEEGPPRKKLRKEVRAGNPSGSGRGGRGGRGKRKPLGVLWEKKVLATTPKDILNVYVFGANRKGELGLQQKDVKEPYWNEDLSGPGAGIVQIATGSHHCVALTYDNRILTWGYNSGGALGRGVPREPDVDQEYNAEPNDWEYTPMPIPEEYFPIPVRGRGPDIADELVFTQVAAGNMFSFALTNDGYVYGWGTFKVSICPKITFSDS
jgi:regulator of chromosome condensation